MVSPECESEAKALRNCAKYATSRGRFSASKSIWVLDALNLNVFPSHEDAQYLYNAINSMHDLNQEWKSVFNNIVAIQDPITPEPFRALVAVVRDLTKIASHEALWATKILVKNCAALTMIAIKESVGLGGGKDVPLDLASTTIRQAFRVTVTDFEGEEPQQGRTLECYSISVCLLRLYVRMHAYSLAEGIMNAINGYSKNIPPLSHSDPKVQVQFLFYRGMLEFYQQKYAPACNDLSKSLEIPLVNEEGYQYVTHAQFEHIMVYLIPSMYLTNNRIPSNKSWDLLPRLKDFYKPLIDASKRGNYTLFLEQLRKHADVLRENRLYLVWDLIILRLKLNLLRRCWEALDRPKRIPISVFASALKWSGFSSPQLTDPEAAEFYISQFILKGEVKGYIHHDLQLLMLSKTQPFPTLIKPIPSAV